MAENSLAEDPLFKIHGKHAPVTNSVLVYIEYLWYTNDAGVVLRIPILKLALNVEITVNY